MPVAFTDSSRHAGFPNRCAAYQKVVENALDLMRPAGEAWSVTMTMEAAATMRLESYEGSDEDGSDGSGGSTDGTKLAGLAISSLIFISAMAKSEASWSCSKTASLMRSAPEKTLISKGSPSGQRRRTQCRLPSEPHSKIGALLNGETDMVERILFLRSVVCCSLRNTCRRGAIGWSVPGPDVAAVRAVTDVPGRSRDQRDLARGRRLHAVAVSMASRL